MISCCTGLQSVSLWRVSIYSMQLDSPVLVSIDALAEIKFLVHATLPV